MITRSWQYVSSPAWSHCRRLNLSPFLCRRPLTDPVARNAIVAPCSGANSAPAWTLNPVTNQLLSGTNCLTAPDATATQVTVQPCAAADVPVAQKWSLERGSALRSGNGYKLVSKAFPSLCAGVFADYKGADGFVSPSQGIDVVMGNCSSGGKEGGEAAMVGRSPLGSPESQVDPSCMSHWVRGG